jgi:hypothetical protein
MSTAILFQRGSANDNFTSQLHDNLEAVEDSPKATLRERAKSLNKSKEYQICHEKKSSGDAIETR